MIESKNRIPPLRMKLKTLSGVSKFDTHKQRKGFFMNKRDAKLMLILGKISPSLKCESFFYWQG